MFFVCVVIHDGGFVKQMMFNSGFSFCLPGAPLKVCPQGFSCCTVEMEEKLSQQSHSDMNAPISKLRTNLQTLFRQKHENFDSKQTYLHKHTHAHQALFRLHCAAGHSAPRPAAALVLHVVWRTLPPASALPKEETVSLCSLACPPVSQRLSPRNSLPFSPERHARVQTDHTHLEILASLHFLFLCVCSHVCMPVNIGIRFLLLRVGVHGNMQQCWVTKEAGQLWIPSATQPCHHCSSAKKLEMIARCGLFCSKLTKKEKKPGIMLVKSSDVCMCVDKRASAYAGQRPSNLMSVKGSEG